ncbi:MAG: indolepyruvate oxidoreductase subunit beta [Oscillospiraceae bacterium]|nr:indolepyruvate oxidoreductase subunit beta [Oscillospiraceae bacterium]
MMTKNIMIVGVGGQGTLLASRLLGTVMVNKGYDVKISEVHGMSQRGGSVVTYVKFGDKVDSPLVDKGEADIVMAFEQLEAARWLPYLKPNGHLIVNTQSIDPMPVINGVAEYPQGIIDSIKATGVSVTATDALSIAVESGSAKAVNVVLIGIMAKHLDITEEEWMSAIESTVPVKFIEMNKKAFLLGYNLK